MAAAVRVWALDVAYDGEWWSLDLPELHLRSRSRRLDEAELVARGRVAKALDVDINEAFVWIRRMDVAGVDMLPAVDTLRTLTDTVDRLARRKTRLAAETAQHLAGTRLPPADIAHLLGLDPEQVARLLEVR